MPYTIVDNFSAGLDSRRHVLNSKPGTLAKIDNAHITRGGEIEKRKAFVHIGSFQSETFGLESTSSGVFTFTPLPLENYGPQQFNVPGVTLVSLPPPLLSNGYYENITNFDSPVMSTVYGGKIFAIMKHGSASNPYGPFAKPYSMAYYDGVAIKDWYQGICDGSVVDNNQFGIREASVSYFSETDTPGYSAEAGYIAADPQDPNWIHDIDGVAPGDESGDLSYIITGKPGIPFTVTPTKTEQMLVTTTDIQKKSDAVAATEAKATFNIVGGKEVNAQIYKASRHMRAYNIPGIRSIRVGASAADADDGVDLLGWNATVGLKYNTFPGAVAGSPAGELFWQIAKVINDNSSQNLNHGYKAVYVTHPGWSGNDPADLWIKAPANFGSRANGDLVQIEFDASPAGIYLISDLIITSTIAVSPYDPTRFIATMGTMSGGSENEITSIKVDGVEVLGQPIAWEQSHGYTASKIQTQMNAYSSPTEYSVSVSGSIVTLSGMSGQGANLNNKGIEVETSGNVIVTTSGSFSGGINAKAALPQKTRVRYRPLGIVPFGAKFGVTITGSDDPTNPIIVGASRMADVFTKDPSFVFTYKSKVYVGFDSVVYFSALNDCTKWDIYDLGSGFIDMANNFGGRERLTGCGVYQDKMVFFTSRGSQTWYMDPDPSLNRQYQVIENSGCVAPESVVSIGSIDLIYLGDNGFRSIRARENTDSAYANDIGSAVDNIVIDHIQYLQNNVSLYTDSKKHSCRGIVEPVDGRLMMFLDDKVYVLSYFSGANISAWSKYELGTYNICRGVALFENKVYVKLQGGTGAAADFYIYGGNDGVTYDDSTVDVEMPYLDASKPATIKEAKGVDMTCEGQWNVYLGFDHTAPTVRDQIAILDQSTFAFGRIMATGYGTHFGPKFTSSAPGKAKIANFIVHFDERNSKHEAG